MAYYYRNMASQASPPPPPSTEGSHIANPAASALAQVMHNSVSDLNDANRPGHTGRVLDPKKIEFKEYCIHTNPNDPFPFHLTFEKVFFFMFYQAFREKKAPSNRWKAGQQRFNTKEYDDMMAVYTGNSGVIPTTFNISKFPLPRHPVAVEVWRQYRIVIRAFYTQQVANKQQSAPWEHIWQTALRTLEKHVKESDKLYTNSGMIGERKRVSKSVFGSGGAALLRQLLREKGENTSSPTG